MSKTTAVHAAVVAPDHVHFHSFPEVPKFEEGTVVLYPTKDAVGLEEMSVEELSQIKKVRMLVCIYPYIYIYIYACGHVRVSVC
jgi:hypothetical protein